jgi:hypothetical protein
MRIDSTGSLLLGGTNTNPAGAGVDGIALSAGGRLNAQVSGQTHRIGRGEDGDIIEFRAAGTPVGSIGNTGSNLYIGSSDTGISFGGGADAIAPFNVSTGTDRDAAIDLGTVTGSSRRFRNLYLSGGVYLGGVGGSNLLDDYEEGTFTPTLTFNSGSATYTSAMRYTKIGRQVTLTGSISVSAAASPSGYIQITLPFATDIATNGLYVGSIYFNDAVNKNAIDFALNAPSVGGTSTARIFLGDVPEVLSANANAEEIQNGTTFVINLTYFTS